MTEQPVMHQVWNDLLFAHWAVPADTLNALLPPPLEVDLYAGEAWVAVVPFYMSDVRLRGLPPVPLTAMFLELNVRTYVTVDDKPGVWFYSLDASNRIAVEVARGWYNLPYFNAQMLTYRRTDTVHYAAHRTDKRANSAMFVARYRPVSDVFHSEPGSLEHFLTERYYLYAVGRDGQLYSGRVDHDPWNLQMAEADFVLNDVAQSHGIHLPDTEPLLHFARKQVMTANAITPVR